MLGAWTHHTFAKIVFDSIIDELACVQELLSILVLELVLSFFEQVSDNVGDVIAVEADLCIFGCFNTDEWSIINFSDFPENFSFA